MNGAWVNLDSPQYISRSSDLKTKVTDVTSVPANYVQGPGGLAALRAIASYDSTLFSLVYSLRTEGYLSYDYVNLVRSQDNGATWVYGDAYLNSYNSNLANPRVAIGSLYGVGVLVYTFNFYSSGAAIGIVRSIDGGATWVADVIRALPGNTQHGIAFGYGLGSAQGGDGLFVIVGNGPSTGSATIGTSPNGAAWTNRNVYDSVTGSVISESRVYTDVAVGANKVVVLNQLGQPVVSTSPECTTFTQYPALPNTHATAFNGKLGYGNGYFMAIGKTSPVLS